MDYKNGKIYTIRSLKRPDLIYVGATCSTLVKRLYEHKKNYRNYSNGGTKFMSSYEVISIGDAYIELKEEFPCENKQQLNRREGEIIREIENCVNRRVEGRDRSEYNKEYYKNNKTRNTERCSIWKNNNREKVRVINKKWRDNNREKVKCECGREVRKNYLTQHKKRKIHKDLMEKLQKED